LHQNGVLCRYAQNDDQVSHSGTHWEKVVDYNPFSQSVSLTGQNPMFRFLQVDLLLGSHMHRGYCLILQFCIKSKMSAFRLPIGFISVAWMLHLLRKYMCLKN